MNKERLCEAFCGELQLRDVPAGYAVKTAFTMTSGDALGFYITRSPHNEKLWRLEDSGLLIPGLEASGVNLETGQRADSFLRLLNEHGASYDSDAMELHSSYVTEQDLPREAMRFISLIMRVQDLELLDTTVVERRLCALHPACTLRVVAPTTCLAKELNHETRLARPSY